MKKILTYNLLTAMIILISSCDRNFDELNTNKTSAIAIDPAFQLNNAVINSSFPTGTLIYEIGIVQQIISPNSGVLTGANYNQDNRISTDDVWQSAYRNVIKNTRDVISRTEADATRSNLTQMARIIQAYNFMILTDTYGDIPYEEGGKGYLDQVYLPAYDAQETIYPKIIQELSEASAALSATGRIETADILYGGDVEKWRKFGYSLMLRAGMRLSKVNETLAQQTVSSAVQGGLILLNADNAFMRHDPNYVNPVGNLLNSTEAANFYLAEPFVEYLQDTDDPRLASIAIRYVGATSGPTQTTANGSSVPAVQVGMPMGNDNATIVGVATGKGLASFYDFSQADRRRMLKPASPNFFVTASQTLLLLAEARERNWITTGTVAEYYNNGVRAHMEQLVTYDAASAVPAGAVDDYLAANPFDATNALEQINTQYWISSFLNGPEAFANFRRTGFPDLAPNPFPGKDISGDFIRRLTYPNSEISVNSVNLGTAVSRMGPDDLETRVWWDVQE